MNIEPLESRIAPAVVVSTTDPKIATYTDVDGDMVTIKVSTGIFTTGLFTTLTVNGHDQLQIVDLSVGGFGGADFTVAVKKGIDGDGLANIGYINATGFDLGAVSVPGDLGVITAGNMTTATGFGVKSLSVQSLGRFGTITGAPLNGDGTLESHITGALGALKIKGSLANAWLHVTGNGVGDELHGTIGSVTIGGSIEGGSTLRAGSIDITGDIGPVKIGHDIIGSVATSSGVLQSDYAKIKSVTLGGSLFGGSAPFTGEIRSSGDLGPVKIGGNVVGGAGVTSAFIASDTGFGADNGKIASVTIAGSLFGGAGPNSGVIESRSDIGPVKIKHDVIGGDGDNSGKIDAGGKVASVTVGGSVSARAGNYNPAPDAGGYIHAGQIFSIGNMGPIKITGSLTGGAGAGGAHIFTEGDMGPVKIGRDVHAGSGDDSARIDASSRILGLTVGGSVTSDANYTSFHDKAGNGHDGQIFAQVSIGPVSIAGSLIGGSKNGGAEIFTQGDIGPIMIGHDVQGGTGNNTGFINTAGKIASVTIKGSLLGPPTVATMAGMGSGGMGAIDAGDLGPVSIGHDIRGASSTGNGSLTTSGSIVSGQRIASLFVGGSIIAGTRGAGTVMTQDGFVGAHEDIGPVVIKGNLVGNISNTAIITAEGQAGAAATKDTAIASVTVGGDVERARILGGFSFFGVGKNGNAQIGAVKVTGDWTASQLVAGVENYGADMMRNPTQPNDDNVNFGDTNDHRIAGGNIAKIASITIGGQVLGTNGGTDHFGFVSIQIGSFKAAGFTAKLTPGTDGPIELSLNTGDVTLREK